MNRRSFFQKIGIGVTAAGISMPNLLANDHAKEAMLTKKTIKAKRLGEKSVVGLIAPSSAPTEENLNKALTNLTDLGFIVKQGPNLRAKAGYLAGTDEQRLADLHWAFADPEIDAVWCVRGGYGCARLLPMVDFDLIRKNPKPFIGYSDITALHLAIGKKTGLITFHGPVGTSDFTEATIQHFRRILVNPTPRYEFFAPSESLGMSAKDEFKTDIITPGFARGNLLGGNLSLLAALIGTPYSPSYKDKIVFLEDIGEQPYRIDRMLTQLLQATDLKKAAGIALGIFHDCFPVEEANSFTLSQTLRDRLGNLGIPVMYGLPFGHISNQATIPCGILAELDTQKRSLMLVEWGVL